MGYRHRLTWSSWYPIRSKHCAVALFKLTAALLTDCSTPHRLQHADGRTVQPEKIDEAEQRRSANIEKMESLVEVAGARTFIYVPCVLLGLRYRGHAEKDPGSNGTNQQRSTCVLASDLCCCVSKNLVGIEPTPIQLIAIPVVLLCNNESNCGLLCAL